MPVLDRYVLRLWLRPTLGFLLLVLVVLLAGRVLRALEYVATKGLSWGWVAALVSAVLPYLLLMAAPIAVFVGWIAVMLSMKDASELDAIQAAGISPLRAFRSVFVAGFLVWIVLLVDSLWWAPAGLMRVAYVFDVLKLHQGAIRLDAQTFVHLEGVTIYVDKVDSDGRLWGLLVEDERSRPPTILWARSGRIVSKKGIAEVEMENGARFQQKRDRMRVLAFEKYRYPLMRMGGIAYDVSHYTADSPAALWRRAQSGDQGALVELARRWMPPMTLPFLFGIAPWLLPRKKRSMQGRVYITGILVVVAVYNSMFALLQLVRRGEAWVFVSCGVVALGSMLAFWLAIRRLKRWGV